jgi:hypothetical protein
MATYTSLPSKQIIVIGCENVGSNPSVVTKMERNAGWAGASLLKKVCLRAWGSIPLLSALFSSLLYLLENLKNVYTESFAFDSEGTL